MGNLPGVFFSHDQGLPEEGRRVEICFSEHSKVLEATGYLLLFLTLLLRWIRTSVYVVLHMWNPGLLVTVSAEGVLFQKELIKDNIITKGIRSEHEFPEKSQRSQQLVCRTSGVKCILKVSPFDFYLYKAHLTKDVPPSWSPLLNKIVGKHLPGLFKKAGKSLWKSSVALYMM